MAQWHVDELRVALEKRGWRVEERVGDGLRTPLRWALLREADGRSLLLDFDGECRDEGPGGSGGTVLPLARCYGCAIPSLGASLSFMRRGEGNTDTRRRWDARLADFVRGLNMAAPHAGPAPGLSAAAEPDAERAAE